MNSFVHTVRVQWCVSTESRGNGIPDLIVCQGAVWDGRGNCKIVFLDDDRYLPLVKEDCEQECRVALETKPGRDDRGAYYVVPY